MGRTWDRSRAALTRASGDYPRRDARVCAERAQARVAGLRRYACRASTRGCGSRRARGQRVEYPANCGSLAVAGFLRAVREAPPRVASNGRCLGCNDVRSGYSVFGCVLDRRSEGHTRLRRRNAFAATLDTPPRRNEGTEAFTRGGTE